MSEMLPLVTLDASHCVGNQDWGKITCFVVCSPFPFLQPSHTDGIARSYENPFGFQSADDNNRPGLQCCKSVGKPFPCALLAFPPVLRPFFSSFPTPMGGGDEVGEAIPNASSVRNVNSRQSVNR